MLDQQCGHIVNLASVAGQAGTNKLVIPFLHFIWTRKQKKKIYGGEGLKTFIYRNGSLADTDLKVDYCASKFACVGLDEALRVEIAVQV